jgi:hypothetical protein
MRCWRISVGVAGLLAAVAVCSAVGAGPQVRAQAGLGPSATPAQVLQAARTRPTGERVRARLRMVVTDSAGHEISRVLRSSSMEHEGATRTLMMFESPAELRGTGLLTIDYDDQRDADQWLYLPSLRRSTRIAMRNRSGAFVGSDFSYADLTVPDPADFTLRMLDAAARVDGEACWHIESVPRNAAVQAETGYERTEMWISQRSLVPLRMKAWLGQERFKYVSASGIAQQDGVYTARTLTARTVRAGRVQSQTVIERLELRFRDPAVVPELFTTRELERGAE